MTEPKTVIKENGTVELFNTEKLARSLLETFRIAQIPDGQAEHLTQKTIRDFSLWQKDKPEITTYDIRLIISKLLENSNPEAAYIFKKFKSMM